MPVGSTSDADFLGIAVERGRVDATLTLTSRLMSADGSLFGGTALASSCVAMEAATERSMRWVTAQFVSGASVGEQLELHVEIAANGRRTSQASVLGKVGDREVFRAPGACASPGGRVSESLLPMPAVSPVKECEPVSWSFGADHERSHWTLKEIREDRSPRVHRGDEAEPSMMWVRMSPPRVWTATMLAFVADMASISILRSASTPHQAGPSLDNSLRLGPTCDDEWVLLASRPQAIHDGYGHATIEIWSPTGTLAAVASQTLSLGSVR